MGPWFRTQIPPPTGVDDASAGAAARSQKSSPPVKDIMSGTPFERCEPDGSFKTRVLFHSATVRFNESNEKLRIRFTLNFRFLGSFVHAFRAKKGRTA